MKKLNEIIDDYSNDSELFCTGINCLDKTLGGICLSEIMIIAARPLMSKTDLVLNMINSISNINSISILYISYKESKNTIIKKLLTVNSGEDRNNYVEIDNDNIKSKAKRYLYNKNIYIENELSNDINEIILSISELKSTDESLKLVVINDIQSIKSTSSNDNIVRDFKALAVKLNITIIILSQLPEKIEYREDKRPLFCDLSKRISRFADVIIFLYRDDYYRKEYRELYYEHYGDGKVISDIIISKNTNKNVGTVKLLYDKKSGTFKSVDKIPSYIE